MKGHPLTVMVVDSDKKHTAAIAPTLRHAGFDLLLCPNGRGAVMMAAYNRPDVILLDVQLDDCDGRDVLKALCSRVQGIPVVLWSARDYDSDKLLAAELGAARYVPKREVGHRLLSIINEVIAMKRIQ